MTLPAIPALTEALRVLGAVALRVEDYRDAGDAAVLAASRLATDLRRAADAHLAAAAGEIARRSVPELGDAGLSRRSGSRTPDELLRSFGMTGRDAAVALRVGHLTQGGGLPVLGDRVLAGRLSVAAAEAIRAGMHGADAPAELVAEAAAMLSDEAATTDPDRLLTRAREVRDALDEAGVTVREELLRSRRSLRRIDTRDGMKRLVWDYDPETAGIVDEIYDRATSPRRGGPRFVDAAVADRAERIARDPRTTEQLASDAFAEVLRQGASVDPAVLLKSGVPSVRVLVSEHALASGVGHGVVEGSGEALDLATVARLACAGGIQAVKVDARGRILDLGREQRLFSTTQRTALAVRDGGCLWPDCDRPPSWCEAHHIDPWSHGGRTDLDRGVLVCRFHHLQLHNGGWKIVVREGRYRLEGPPGSGKPSTWLDTKSRALREHLARDRVADPPGSAGSPGSYRSSESRRSRGVLVSVP